MTETERDEEIVELVPDQGEDETDFGDAPVLFSASIGAKDWTVETLISQMRKGRIDLEPAFQRRNAWLDNRKSKLIESMLLGFPIPQIVLAEKPETPGHFLVLDGKQRLLALRQYFVEAGNPVDADFEPFTLSGLEVLKDRNGNDVATLAAQRPDLLASLENYSIRTVVLSNWNSDRLLLSLFLRLNTGSVPLSPQELRQALVPGPFMSWLDLESGKLQPLRDLLGNTGPDRRMVDAELSLRHIAFSESDLQYRGNLKQFLDETSAEFNRQWKTDEAYARRALGEMGEAILFGRELFQPNEFSRKWTISRFERALNRAVFDVQAYSFSFPDVRSALHGRSEDVISAFKIACDTNIEFSRSISATTKTRDAFLVRHNVWRDIVKSIGGVNYPLPAPLLI